MSIEHLAVYSLGVPKMAAARALTAGVSYTLGL